MKNIQEGWRLIWKSIAGSIGKNYYLMNSSIMSAVCGCKLAINLRLAYPIICKCTVHDIFVEVKLEKVAISTDCWSFMFSKT